MIKFLIALFALFPLAVFGQNRAEAIYISGSGIPVFLNARITGSNGAAFAAANNLASSGSVLPITGGTITGNLTVSGTTFEKSFANTSGTMTFTLGSGGAVFNGGPLAIHDSLAVDNTSTFASGAIVLHGNGSINAASFSSVGNISTGSNTVFSSNGSASTAGGNITWDTAGTITNAGSIVCAGGINAPLLVINSNVATINSGGDGFLATGAISWDTAGNLGATSIGVGLGQSALNADGSGVLGLINWNTFGELSIGGGIFLSAVDGSGHFANGGISWDSSGALTVNGNLFSTLFDGSGGNVAQAMIAITAGNPPNLFFGIGALVGQDLGDSNDPLGNIFAHAFIGDASHLDFSTVPTVSDGVPGHLTQDPSTHVLSVNQ